MTSADTKNFLEFLAVVVGLASIAIAAIVTYGKVEIKKAEERSIGATAMKEILTLFHRMEETIKRMQEENVDRYRKILQDFQEFTVHVLKLIK